MNGGEGDEVCYREAKVVWKERTYANIGIGVANVDVDFSKALWVGYTRTYNRVVNQDMGSNIDA